MSRPIAGMVNLRLAGGVVALVAVCGCAGCKRSDEHASAEAATPVQAGRPGDTPVTDLESERDQSAAASTSPEAVSFFTDVTEAAGLTHRHHKPVLDHKLDHIMSWVSSVGAAAASGDFDNDGWLDLYVTDSRKGFPNYLYRNNGDGTFTDVADRAGVADANGPLGTSMDCIWGDFDNDGWADLYLVRWGRDAVFHNNGDGTFTDVTDKLFKRYDGSPGTDWANGNAAIFLDFNLDGRLDIYVGNYFAEIDLWNLKSTRIMHDSFEMSRNAGPNYLYQQQADGTFVEVARSLGVDDSGWTLAVGSADVNNDGWPDLYCADDFGPDQLFLNNRDGTFRNVSDDAIGPDTKKGMNVDFGDFNNDGWLDIYVTNITTAEYLQEGNMLWHNNGPGDDGKVTFTDISLETGTYDGGWGWGGKFFDFDHDGDLDIISLNGFISAGKGNYWYDLASWTVTEEESADAANWPAIGDRSFSGYERNRLFRNDGMYLFTERAADLGVSTDRDGRGVVVFDYDNDGDLDLYLANQDQPPNLYRNDGRTGGHYLMVDLEAHPEAANSRDAIGARVTVMTSQGIQIRERDGGNGYSGQSDPRLHFGLGSDMKVKLLEVRWPDGGLQYVEDVPADRLITVRQDPSRYASQVAMNIALPRPWVRANHTGAPARRPIDPAELDRMLSEVEGALRASADSAQRTNVPAQRASVQASTNEAGPRPSGSGLDPTASRPTGASPSMSFSLASTYRARCVEHDQHDRSIRFFEKLVQQHPEDWHARVELACAYIDKIPTCGGIAAIVSKGTLARRSLDQLNIVIDKHPDMWAAYYCRGMNHLHWPRALRHSDDAVSDLTHCLKLQRLQDAGPSPYFIRTHIALGDAYAKAKQYDDARKAWREGLALFADSQELIDRLAIADNAELLSYVESQRSLEQPIDTGLSFLDP